MTKSCTEGIQLTLNSLSNLKTLSPETTGCWVVGKAQTSRILGDIMALSTASCKKQRKGISLYVQGPQPNDSPPRSVPHNYHQQITISSACWEYFSLQTVTDIREMCSLPSFSLFATARCLIPHCPEQNFRPHLRLSWMLLTPVSEIC